VEAARALLDHDQPLEAEPFARRAVSLDPSPENEELLQRVLTAAAARPPEPRPAEKAEPGAGAAETSPSPEAPAGLLSRLFRHKG
jgi:hypothetical protein